MYSHKVSIIIPYYKKKKFILKTLNSIFNQTYKNYEILIIYDDESDTDLLYLRKITKNIEKIKIYKNKKNLGPGRSRNIGIKHAKGSYIAFCDADDIWNKDKLKIQIRAIIKKKINFIHSSYYIINNKNLKIGIFQINKKLKYNDLLKSCDIGLSTVIISKKLLLKNKFNNFKTKEDYCLWLKLIKKEKFFYGIDKCLVRWRQLNNSQSTSVFQRIYDGFNVFFKEEKFNLFLSLYYLIRLSFNAFKKKIKIKKSK